MLVLGITGGIATGKSAVMKILGDLGALTLSADDLARDVLAKDTPAYNETVDRFGKNILTESGDIDRAALGSIIFRDVEARAALEAITHPRIIELMENAIDQFRSDPPKPDAVLAVEIPLLIECGLDYMVDKVVVVAAEQETQLCRLTKRCAISHEEALRRISAQMPLALKIERADRVIVNDGSMESLERAVRSMWDEICLL